MKGGKVAFERFYYELTGRMVESLTIGYSQARKQSTRVVKHMIAFLN